MALGGLKGPNFLRDLQNTGLYPTPPPGHENASITSYGGTYVFYLEGACKREDLAHNWVRRSVVNRSVLGGGCGGGVERKDTAFTRGAEVFNEKREQRGKP